MERHVEIYVSFLYVGWRSNKYNDHEGIVYVTHRWSYQKWKAR